VNNNNVSPIATIFTLEMTAGGGKSPQPPSVASFPIDHPSSQVIFFFYTRALLIKTHDRYNALLSWFPFLSLILASALPPTPAAACAHSPRSCCAPRRLALAPSESLRGTCCFGVATARRSNCAAADCRLSDFWSPSWSSCCWRARMSTINGSRVRKITVVVRVC
jgi:hypothetical protein